MTTPSPLLALGFTEIEAEVYTALLASSPVTGYRVSQAIGKPTANTYKAIASLQKKGAVLVDDGDKSLCRPVPPDELVDCLAREHGRQCRAARDALRSIGRGDHDDRVYRLTTAEQVLERARTILAEARSLVMGDVFPAAAAALSGAWSDAVGRGVRVVLHVYAEPAEPAFDWVLSDTFERALVDWPGQQLTLVADGEEHLMALLDDELSSVHQAVWSNSTFLSCMQHNHVAAELRLSSRLRGGERRPGELAPAALDDLSLLNAGVPGLATLQRRYASRSGAR